MVLLDLYFGIAWFVVLGGFAMAVVAVWEWYLVNVKGGKDD